MLQDKKKELRGGGRVLCLLRPPTHSATASRFAGVSPYFLAAGIAIIRALKAIQCSVVLSRPQTSRTRKADCRCAGEPRTPRVAHMVGTPFGVPEVRFLLRAFTAAEAAFGHSRSCGSGERWNDPVLPNRARPPNRWHMPGQRALDGPVNVLLVLAKTGSSGSNELRRAYFGPHFRCLTPPFLDSKESNRVLRLLLEFWSIPT